MSDGVVFLLVAGIPALWILGFAWYMWWDRPRVKRESVKFAAAYTSLAALGMTRLISYCAPEGEDPDRYARETVGEILKTVDTWREEELDKVDKKRHRWQRK